MSTTYGNQFLNGYKIPTTAENAYEVLSTQVKNVIQYARIENYGSDQETFTLWMVPDGESNDDNYKAIIEKPIQVGETIPLYEIIEESLLTGGSIWIQASTVNTLSASIGGSIEIT